jgi:hypothetical protein
VPQNLSYAYVISKTLNKSVVLFCDITVEILKCDDLQLSVCGIRE